MCNVALEEGHFIAPYQQNKRHTIVGYRHDWPAGRWTIRRSREQDEAARFRASLCDNARGREEPDAEAKRGGHVRIAELKSCEILSARTIKDSQPFANALQFTLTTLADRLFRF